MDTINLPEPYREALAKLQNDLASVLETVTRIEVQSMQHATQENSEIFLNVKEIAELTKYSEQTVRTKIMTDDIPTFKMNGRRLARKSVILEWVKRGGALKL